MQIDYLNSISIWHTIELSREGRFLFFSDNLTKNEQIEFSHNAVDRDR